MLIRLLCSGILWLGAMLSVGRGGGTVLAQQSFSSKFLKTDQTVRIYLPPSYAKETSRRYPVLYLHDGQNVFTQADTNACFGWGDWHLDQTVDQLIASNRMPPIIMVAIDSGPDRMEKYSGRFAPDRTNTFENYAHFLIDELKPRINKDYRTLPDAPHTAVMGSSLGGICSLALAWEYPETFGCAASLSGAFQINREDFLNYVLIPYHDRAKPPRVYLDSGIVDYTGGDDNCLLTKKVFEELNRIEPQGTVALYTDKHIFTDAELASLSLRRDKWAEAKTSQHNEFYWRQRSWRALTFLFPITPHR